MKKKWLAVALSAIMVVGCLTGCGSSTDKTASNDAASNGGSGDAAVEKLADGGGKVLNVYVWNEEFSQRLEKFSEYDKDKKMIGDVKVNFIQNANEGNNYQDKLDAALKAQDSAEADKKVDIFLCEMDYVNKYTGTDYAVDVKSLGITDEDMSNQYDYVKQAATDGSGVLRGLSWQGCPGGFVYRRSYAKDIFGTDDPEKIQEQVADWDKFAAAAQTVKDKSNGKITMLSGFDDACRVYTSNVSSKFVTDDNKINLDPNVEKWIDDTKEYTDKGYNNKTTLWKPNWSDGIGKNGNVFGYFMPAWGISFSMADASGSKKSKDGKYLGGGSYGDWGLCLGPQSFNWGGSFICAAKGTDNADLVAKIMKALTCDQDVMYNISKDYQDFVNNKAANEKLVADNVTSDFLGGQSLVKTLSDSADKINAEYVSPYDQGCIENLQSSMKNYFLGKCSKEEGLAEWKKNVKKVYPGLSE